MSRLSKLREKYARAAVKILLIEGVHISVNNGVFNVCNRETEITAICEAMFSHKIDRLYLYLSPNPRLDPKPYAWVEFDYTVPHTGLFADYSPIVATLLAGLETALLAEVIEDRRKTREGR